MWPQQQFGPWMQFPQSQSPQQGLLGLRPQQLLVQGQHNNAANRQYEPTTDFVSAFNTMTLVNPTNGQLYMDSGATAHLTNAEGNLKFVFKHSTGKTVTIANGGKIPISSSGSLSLNTPFIPLSL